MFVVHGMKMKGRKWNSVQEHSLLLSISIKGTARFNVPIRRTNRYQQYNIPSQHNVLLKGLEFKPDFGVQSRDLKLYISILPTVVLIFKIFLWKFSTSTDIEPQPSEPEADMPSSQPARLTSVNSWWDEIGETGETWENPKYPTLHTTIVPWRRRISNLGPQ